MHRTWAPHGARGANGCGTRCGDTTYAASTSGCGEPLFALGEISRARVHVALRHQESHPPCDSETNGEPTVASEGTRVGRCGIPYGDTLRTPPALGCAPGAQRLCPSDCGRASHDQGTPYNGYCYSGCAFGREPDPYCGERHFEPGPETVAIPPDDVRPVAVSSDACPDAVRPLAAVTQKPPPHRRRRRYIEEIP